MPYKNKTYAIFAGQRRGARQRKIVFEFTFDEWVTWWKKHLGPHWKKKRGHKRHQYVMGRYGDKGPYSINNVSCITASQNMADSNYNFKRGGGSNFLGRKHSKETINKMSKLHKGKRNPFFGKKHSVKARLKMRLAQARRYGHIT